jgi:hypothetical protein
MAFRNYTTLGEVLTAFQIQNIRVAFPEPIPSIIAPDGLRQELAFVQQAVFYRNSEAAVCENIIYPILKEVWRPFSDTLAIWSHQPISLNNDLNGIPDYMFAKKSPLGRAVFESPFVAVVEAKRDDFTLGWVQCLQEMYAIQHLNSGNQPVFGIVSNGDNWQVGELHQHIFTEYIDLFAINKLDEVFSALTYILATCKRIYNL